MKKILQQIANTIVANLANTEPVGLFSGKMGLCLFLFRYARYSGSMVYEDIASELLDNVFNQLKPNMSPSIVDGLGGIGYGLTTLLKEGLLDSDPEDNLLEDIDKILLYDIRSSFMKELHNPNPLYSSGMYLLSRLDYDKDSLKPTWISNVVTQTHYILSDSIRQKKFSICKLSLLNSILYVSLRLSELGKIETDMMEHLLRNILYLSNQAIHQGCYREIDMLLFRKNISQLSPTLGIECDKLCASIEESGIHIIQNKLDMWYDNLWWSILYEMPVVEDISLSEMERYIDKKVEESYFDGFIVNTNLAATGLWLMREK